MPATTSVRENPDNQAGSTGLPVNATLWHALTHRLRPRLWMAIDHLPVPGYQDLYRQQCLTCGTTRVQNLL